MESKLLSIIVPVYNVEKYIGECLDSIIDQRYQNIEIILIDDGSQDASGGICDDYALRDERIKVIHKKNAGVSNARNDGLKFATGEYITFVDPDDVVHRDIYTRLVEALEDNCVDACCCAYRNWIEGKYITSTPNEGTYEGLDVMKNLMQEDYYTTVIWNKVFRRESITESNGEIVLFDSRFTVGEDEKWLFDVILKKNIDMLFISNPLYDWRKRENSAINQNSQGITRQKLDGIKIQEDLAVKAHEIGNVQLEALFLQKLYEAKEQIAKNCYQRKDNDSFVKYYAQIRGQRSKKRKNVNRKMKDAVWRLMMELRYRKLIIKHACSKG